MQDFENQIVSGDCIELLRQAEEPFADLVSGRVLREQAIIQP
jgi:hypothetical protein